MTGERDTMMAIRLSEEERGAIEDAAERAGLTASAWLRLVAVAGAGDEKLIKQLRKARRQGKA